MKRALLVLILMVFILGGFVPECSQMGCCSMVRAEDAKNQTARITATEPAAIISGIKTTLKVRGFMLKEARDMRFPMAVEVKAEITEKKDSGPPKGMENKIVGDSQLIAEFTLPAHHPVGILEYVIATPAGDATGKIMVLAAETFIDETEPNNAFREAHKMQLGQSSRGSIQGDKDVDVYAFLAKAGQQLKVTVTSGGSLLMDAAVHCYDPRGQFLAAADDGESRDPVLMLKLQTDSEVFLCVSSAHDVGGEWHSYLLTVEELK
ncbi:MAG: hypothetical protein MUQ48_05300 [Pirellulales bacterium]|nr:hypothetical protein [Pirellulales bacterium]